MQSWAEVIEPERKRNGRLEDLNVVALGRRALSSSDLLELVVEVETVLMVVLAPRTFRE